MEGYNVATNGRRRPGRRVDDSQSSKMYGKVLVGLGRNSDLDVLLLSTGALSHMASVLYRLKLNMRPILR